MYEHVANEPKTIYHPIKDGQEFDLGDRIVTAYYAPGHAMDELIFLDHKTRTLFSGDSINYNTTMAGIPIEESIGYLRRIQSLSDQYDDIYNGHHDYRALGAPLGKDCLPNLIALAEEYLSGNYCEPALVPSFWDGQRTARMMLRRGRNFASAIQMRNRSIKNNDPVKIMKEVFSHEINSNCTQGRDQSRQLRLYETAEEF